MVSGADAVRAEFEKAGQGHVFAHAHTHEDLQKLLSDLADVDPVRVNRIVEVSLKHAESASEAIEPFPNVATVPGTKAERPAWFKRGIELIRDGKAAALLMAGGQGTRLGSSNPKGMFDIGLQSHKSLFQLQAERIARLQKVANGVLPWYIMTSDFTHSLTVQFFTEHKFFGLDSANVVFFRQGTLPCVDNNGKIILDQKLAVARAPDGNGGLYAAIVKNKVVDDMRRRGVQYIHVYGVDSATVKVADPVFFGFMDARGLDCAAKTVEKTNPKEAVGLICQRGGHPCVVEYSEISAEAAAARSEDGSRLRFAEGNIANHCFRFAFLNKCAEECMSGGLPFHIARKKIAYVNEVGERIVPTQNSGIKLESFIFDVFPLCPMDKMGVLEVERAKDFAPVKNANGAAEDTPDTARDLVSAEGRLLLEAAGCSVTGSGLVEVSPLVAYSEFDIEDLAGATQGRKQQTPVLL